MSHPTVNPFRLTSGEGGPAIVTAPVIDGIVDAGEVLTLTQQPVWDGTEVSSGWVWTADGSEVPGSADQVTITLPADINLVADRYQVVASATNAAGGTSYSRSNALDKVFVPEVPPAIVTAPIIAGSILPDETLTLTQAPVWDGTESSSSWIWQADGVDIPGTQNAATYDLPSSGLAGAYRVVATATNAAGTNTSNSNTLRVGVPTIVTSPVISGLVESNETLTLTQAPVWDGTESSSSWIWQGDGVDIPGTQNAATYDLPATGLSDEYRVEATAANATGSSTVYSNTLNRIPATIPDAPVAGQWSLELGPAGLPIVTGIYSLEVGQQGKRVGKTSGTGAVNPGSVAGFQITRLQANIASGKVRFRLQNYNLAFVGQIRISYGTNFQNVAVLDFDGDAEWDARNFAFTRYLAAHVGNTVFLQVGG